MPSRADHRRPRDARPPTRRRALAHVGLTLPLAAAVAFTGSSAEPVDLAHLSRSAAVVAGWRAEAASAKTPEGATEAGLRDAIVRSAPERASRNTERAQAATLAAESARRAATEAALAANEQVKDITTVPPPVPVWERPLEGGYVLTSGFGARGGGMHPAQDFATPVGTPVRSPSNGTVLFSGWDGGYGNKVEIQLSDGTVVWFAHNSALGVTQGQAVVTGQVIAASGNTGHSTGPHVHLEVHPGGGDPVPVMEWLAARGIPM